MKPLKLTIKRKADLLRMCKKLFPEYNEIRFGSITAEGDIAEYDKKFIKKGFSMKDPISCDFLWFEKDFKYNHDADIERSATYVIHWLELCLTHLAWKLLSEENDCYIDDASQCQMFTGNWNNDKMHPVDYLYMYYKKLTWKKI